uniref:Lysophospholipase L1 n=1 Tax=Candidatus Kentrum sp. MB TaxID=2138164 RepID=A0A450X6V7_9GAMM|nr:MAG: Lysophospholipase L1 [Candidatus Kentron sp. MB]VFK35438.1 MAG: Lysophospholipase L1 [Candidatus Kentron sp. MB]VFK77298.1 MAG: Lysophospholipase L1 [Candidatus Kentron sp. MB]
MRLENGQSILFTGDSITDCGRAYPVGTGMGLGEGYVAFVDNLLTVHYPERHIRIFNTGVNGDTIIDLHARWQRDILRLGPDWLSIMIGINDVWRQFDPYYDPEPLRIDRYEANYRKLLSGIRQDLKGLVLMTPYFIEPDCANLTRQYMDAFGAVVERLAREFDAVFVDVQAGFNRYLSHRPARSLTDDGAHTTKTGHMIIAESFLSAIGFRWCSDVP